MGRQLRNTTPLSAVCAAALLIAGLPLLLVAAVMSAWCFKAWPVFVHTRVGAGGQHFRMYKIRTLPPCTNRYVSKYALDVVDIPPAMRLIRRLHIDELPQLWHVVTGEMSFVGPRPEMPDLHDLLPASFAMERTSVRPGLTGLWQISPHNAGLIRERPEYDRLYVGHRWFWLDAWIMFRTVQKMTSGRTTQLYDVPLWAIPPVGDLDIAPSAARIAVRQPAMPMAEVA